MAKRQFSADNMNTVAELLNHIAKFVKNPDPKVRMRVAKNVVRDMIKGPGLKSSTNSQLLNSLDETFAQQQRYDNYSYVNTGNKVNSDAKDISPPDESTNQDRSSCIMAYENAGYSSAASLEACNSIFGPTPNVVGGTSTVTRNAEQGKTKVTTWTPKQGRIPLRSASTEVPSWVVTSGLENEYSKYMSKAPVNTKSAAVDSVPEEYFGESISSLMNRKAENRRNKVESSNRLLSASSSKPSWVRSLSMFDGVT